MRGDENGEYTFTGGTVIDYVIGDEEIKLRDKVKDKCEEIKLKKKELIRTITNGVMDRGKHKEKKDTRKKKNGEENYGMKTNMNCLRKS